MADHSDLVAEIPTVEKMTTPERLKHAKKRRSQQLKRYSNYEKQLEKDKNKKNKQSQNQRRQQRKRARVKFIHNIMLLEAASRNDIEEVKRLLMAGVSPDVTNEDGLTALHQCCIDDSEDMLKLLLEFGANVNAKDSEMWTPLHAAATCGHVHLCKCLIDKGAELLAVNADGNMPYDICEDEVCLDFIETEMAKRGITQEEIDEKRLETERQMLTDLKKLAAEKRNLEYRDEHRATPLHIAAANGYLDVVEFLLDHHVSMEMRDEDGWLPLHAAACWLQPEVIELLVKNGADLDAKTRGGETAFDLAEDPDVKQKILDLKDELETHRATRNSKDHVHKRRVTSRGISSGSGPLYSSNSSLNEKPVAHGHRSTSSANKQSLNNPASASIRRTSMRGDKRPLFKKEAKEEALHFGMMSMANDDDDLNDLDDEKENVPATNIDDVKIIIDDEIDKYDKTARISENISKDNRNSVSPSEKRKSQPESKNLPVSVSINNRNSQVDYSPQKDSHEKQRSSSSNRNSQVDNSHQKVSQEKQKPRDSGVSEPSKIEQTLHGESQKRTRHSETDQHRSESREPIHVHMGRLDSGSHVETQRSSPPREQEPKENRSAPAVHPHTKNLQGQTNIGRTPSFTKKRDSVRKVREDQALPNVNKQNTSGTGTLADLKKQRSEQHKFGNSLDAQVQNLFLSSLSDSRKYSGGSHTQQQNSSNENTLNGRNSKALNNNNNSVPPRPPTFLSDNGPLRRFSAPTSSPVIGEDDKFKSNCCTIL